MRPESTRFHKVLALLALALAAFAAPARAAECPACDEVEALLLSPDLRSDADRAGEAADLLAADRRRKLAEMSSAFVDFGLNASVAPNPLRLLRSAGEIGDRLRDWDLRSSAEDEALTLLEPAAQNGALDAAAAALYERLQTRAEQERVARLLSSGEAALARDDLRGARRNVDRALELEPGSPRADELLDRIEEREWSARAEGELDADPTRAPVDAWEVRLASALLLEDYARASELGPAAAPEAEFGRAAALHLEGERARAHEAFAALAQGDDRTAARAQRVLADPELFPEQALAREATRYKRQRALGWVGGEALVEAALPDADDALALSKRGYSSWQGTYKAWRGAARPINLVLDAPARVFDDWQPEGLALRGAAERMLELEPDGARAAEASAWLVELSGQESARASVAPFRDGVLVLPRSRTRYGRVSDTRVVVARAALESELGAGAAELPLGDAPALLLSIDPADAEVGAVLAQPRALELLAQLARGLDDAALEARGGSAHEVPETLRRLHASVRAGAALHAQPWQAREHDGLAGLGNALTDGGRTRTLGDVLVQRDDEDLFAERDLSGSGPICPARTACIDRTRAVASGLYAQTSADGGVGVGARASFQDAKFAVEVSSSGPRVSLVLPVARWLGLARFFPVEASLAVGVDGVSAGPRYDKGAEDLPPSSL